MWYTKAYVDPGVRFPHDVSVLSFECWEMIVECLEPVDEIIGDVCNVGRCFAPTGEACSDRLINIEDIGELCP